MIKVFEMFSGYGGASFSLKKADIRHEVIGYSEIDKYAIQCYENNHKVEVLSDEPEDREFTYEIQKNYGDCTKINPEELPDFDLLTGGFPCQSFSVAGKRLGELDTRGTLFYEIIRIAEIKKPKYMLLENVKGLTTKKHKETFRKILSELRRVGYDVLWKVLNTKNYGIPQNRERVFFVCKLGKWEFNEFQFPQEEELEITIQNILEDEVNKKYCLSELMQQRMRKYLKEKQIHTNNVPMILGYSRDNKGKIQNYHKKDIAGSIKASVSGRTSNQSEYIIDGILIRRITPKECFRLMGFLNDEINLDGLSDTQKYKLAGNGWDINLVSKLFKEMFKNDK